MRGDEGLELGRVGAQMPGGGKGAPHLRGMPFAIACLNGKDHELYKAAWRNLSSGRHLHFLTATVDSDAKRHPS